MKFSKENWKQVSMAFLSAAGVLVMGYLFSVHFVEEAGSFCSFGKGLSCDIVNKSEYSTVLGIPVAAMGFLYFLAVFYLIVFKFEQKNIRNLFLATVAFLGPSLYLTGVEIFIIKNICVFCELSKVIMLALAIIAWLSMEKKSNKSDYIYKGIIYTLILAFAIFVIQAKSVGQRKYDTFAQCLTEKGLVMYGSATCSFCAKQKQMFGKSFEYINEVECNPNYNKVEAELCAGKNIEGTPTWMIEDEQGNELQRLTAGLRSFEELGEAVGCEVIEDEQLGSGSEQE